MLKMIKQVRRDPSRWIKRRNTTIDFRVPSLPHLVVKEAEHLRVQELVQRIENHHHRAALQADFQQNNVYNPFSENSKEMIRELGKCELFELCGTTPKVPCSQCLLYWNQGIVSCTCGQCLIYSESSAFLDHEVRDRDCIQPYLVKLSSGFAVNQALSASARHNSLIPIKKT